MSSNLPQTNPANMPTESALTGVKNMLLEKGLATFKGWWARKSLVWIPLIMTSVTLALHGSEVKIVDFLSLQGVSGATLQLVHDLFVGIVENIGKLVTIVLAVTSEALLSRVAAKVKEEPIIPVAPIENRRNDGN